MDVSELPKAKRLLESEIKDLIDEFEHQFGHSVTNVHLEINSYIDGKRELLSVRITAEIR